MSTSILRFLAAALLTHAALADDLLFRYSQSTMKWLESLPKAWPDGKVAGLRARGGFEVGLEWNQGQFTTATVRSLNGNVCRVRYGDEARAVTLAKGETKRVH